MFSFSVILISVVLSPTLSFSISSSRGSDASSAFDRFSTSLVDQSSQPDSSEYNNDQSIPLPCYRIRPNVRQAHPINSRKYYVCRDDYNYEVYTCPNGGVFDPTEKACFDLCQQKNPCLNDGQCIILPDLQLQCVCRRDWTGEQCETPLSSCTNDPCGPDGECRMLKALDFSQDYVCICNNQQSYGRNCQQTVPNPCLSSTEQFHPFAYSRRAYINCDDELIFFQPCNALLYWDQEEKRCDRSLPELLRMPFVNFKPQQQQQQKKPLVLIASNRNKFTQWQDGMDELENDRSRFGSTQTDEMIQQRQPWRSQTGQWQENRLKENQPAQRQDFPTFSQRLSAQTWSNQMPDTRMQVNQRFFPQTEAPQNQRQSLMKNTLMETTMTTPQTTTTTTTTAAPRIFRLQGFSARIPNEQASQWKPMDNNQMPSSTGSDPSSMTNPQQLQGPTTVQGSLPMSQNMQFGSDVPQQQTRRDQMPASPLETATNNDMSSGMIRHSLFGWKSKPQESFKHASDKSPLGAIPSFQLKSWKS